LESIIARREQDDNVIRSIKEPKVTPDNAIETVGNILSSAPVEKKAMPSSNPAMEIGVIRRLLGLGNRMLTDGEINAFTKWRHDYGFRYELIYYAYQIMQENGCEYSLPYMDAILSRWHARKLTTMEEIKAYEQGFKEERDKARSKPKPPLNAPAQNSSFDTNEFFMAAVKRSFGDDFDPSILEQ
jgi:DnaD/phage-associated family protein